jgi:hypothetical protein
MKQLSLTPILRALRHAPYLYVLPLPKSLVPASLGTVIAVLFVLARVFGTCSRQLFFVAQSPANLNTAPFHN